MTVTLDLSPLVAGRVEADARAQNRPVAELLRDAVIDLYDPSDDEADDLPADFYEKHPLPASLSGSLADDLREAFADVDAGRMVPGHVALAELRQRAGLK